MATSLPGHWMHAEPNDPTAWPDYAEEAARYGNLARVAINFHIQTGQLGELDLAYWYARYAGRAGNIELHARTIDACLADDRPLPADCPLPWELPRGAYPRREV